MVQSSLIPPLFVPLQIVRDVWFCKQKSRGVGTAEPPPHSLCWEVGFTQQRDVTWRVWDDASLDFSAADTGKLVSFDLLWIILREVWHSDANWKVQVTPAEVLSPAGVASGKVSCGSIGPPVRGSGLSLSPIFFFPFGHCVVLFWFVFANKCSALGNLLI